MDEGAGAENVVKGEGWRGHWNMVYPGWVGRVAQDINKLRSQDAEQRNCNI